MFYTFRFQREFWNDICLNAVGIGEVPALCAAAFADEGLVARIMASEPARLWTALGPGDRRAYIGSVPLCFPKLQKFAYNVPDPQQ